MSTVLAFGFVPGGRFSLSDYRSFDPAIPHQFIHVAFAASAASSTLWPTRKAARSAPRPSHKAATSTPQYFSEVLPVVAAASSVPRPSHKAAKSAPRSSHKTLVLAPQPSCRVVSAVPVTSPSPRCLRKASSAPQHLGLLGRSPLLSLLPPRLWLFGLPARPLSLLHQHLDLLTRSSLLSASPEGRHHHYYLSHQVTVATKREDVAPRHRYGGRRGHGGGSQAPAPPWGPITHRRSDPPT
ncbi:hypothetical protein ACLOJK_018692 [Asimina triloba]